MSPERPSMADLETAVNTDLSSWKEGVLLAGDGLADKLWRAGRAYTIELVLDREGLASELIPLGESTENGLVISILPGSQGPITDIRLLHVSGKMSLRRDSMTVPHIHKDHILDIRLSEPET